MLNYKQAVEKNLAHLGTPAGDWKALPILGAEKAEDDEGRIVEMPAFDFPKGYESAPSLYKGECCNLCGTRIKIVYWIQNDKRRWIMPVGSECVTHFGDGEAGNVLAKKAVWESNRLLLRDILQVRQTIWKTYSRRINQGYGCYETRIWPHTPKEREAASLYQEVKKCVGKITIDSKDATVSRWANKNKDQALQLILKSKPLIDADKLNDI